MNKIKNSKDKMLVAYAWGIFFIFTGLTFIIPDMMPDGIWFMGTGIILISLNLIRKALNLKTSGFTIILGIVGLYLGLINYSKAALGASFILAGLLFVYFSIGRKHHKDEEQHQ